MIRRKVGVGPIGGYNPPDLSSPRNDKYCVPLQNVRGRTDVDGDVIKLSIGGTLVGIEKSDGDDDMNQLFGYTTRMGGPVALVSPTWVTIYSETDIAKLIRIKAATLNIIGGVPMGTAWRIRACPNGYSKRVIFPAGNDTGNTFPDNVEMTFSEMVQIPFRYDWDVQVYCTAAMGASVALADMKLMEMGW